MTQIAAKKPKKTQQKPLFRGQTGWLGDEMAGNRIKLPHAQPVRTHRDCLLE